MTAAERLWGKALALAMAAVLSFGLAGVVSASVATQEAYAATSVSAVAKQCKGKSATAKLKSLNSYMKTNFGYKTFGTKIPSRISASKAKAYANSLCKSGRGSCVEWASLCAVAAKSATKCPVRICSGSVDGYNPNHCWVEVKVGGKWLVCDPLQEKVKGSSLCCKGRQGCSSVKTSTI